MTLLVRQDGAFVVLFDRDANNVDTVFASLTARAATRHIAAIQALLDRVQEETVAVLQAELQVLEGQLSQLSAVVDQKRIEVDTAIAAGGT